MITVSYLWIALHFHDTEFGWWTGLLAFVLDSILFSSLKGVPNNITLKR